MNQTILSRSGYDFIDEDRLHGLLDRKADASQVRDIVAKSLSKQPLTVDETAALLAADSPELVEQIFDAARQLKRDVYGNRIVLFAPLYVGNNCTNDCVYCAFRRSNREAVRRTLDEGELRQQVLALEKHGHKRLILVFGEHPHYDAAFMAECIHHVYATTAGKGEIRRVNLNAAPLDHDGYATVKAAGIGTYQIFQETYHHETYRRMHPEGTRKANYLWRLDGVARAMEAQCDDVGIGALFGLYDWRFEVLALVSHALAPAKALQRRPAHDQLSPVAAGAERTLGRDLSGGQRGFQAAGGDSAVVGAVYGPDLHGPRAARSPPRNARFRRFTDRCRQPS